uniref:Uncharacterized protein n=1 Tax=Eutreptiella gymnastica TaxID=73025 RepID=A0A7S1NU22_9EUGL|mmetsp:Transcript_89190/g.154566  ORF Transcript_89190/g.154566 Transcript_89190/m.154566 type:complete len:102 (+) Transcript_89190:230-535(+)
MNVVMNGVDCAEKGNPPKHTPVGAWHAVWACGAHERFLSAHRRIAIIQCMQCLALNALTASPEARKHSLLGDDPITLFSEPWLNNPITTIATLYHWQAPHT